MKRLAITLLLLCFFGLTSYSQSAVLSQASWISSEDTSLAVPVFFRSIIIDRDVAQATLYITAHGIYEATINQKGVSTAVFAPGFTSYDHRLQYQSYDTGCFLKKGANKLQITIAGGWYGGIFGGRMTRGNYGTDLSVAFALVITFKDGSKKTVYSDKQCRVGTGTIQAADFYGGETTDSRKPLIFKGFTKIIPQPRSLLVPTVVPLVKPQEQFLPKKIWQLSKDTFMVDFGQNLAGWIRLNIRGRSGDTVSIAHAEMLTPQGDLFTQNLREARATDTYILNGRRQQLSPHFTYHGFRYAKISGFVPTYSNCAAVAVYTRLKPSGSFACSDPMLNRLQNNIRWSMNSNFVDIPTDCPQRSERLGWTGDARAFCRTAAFNRDVKAFYEKWLADLMADQGPNGGLPNIIPDVYGHQNQGKKGGVAGWGDAATIIPWTLYEMYGDKRILKNQYSSMKAWVDYITAQTDGALLWKAGGYGDWYAPGDSTSLHLISQCFYAQSVNLLVKTAQTLNNREDLEKYTHLLTAIRAAFLKTYGQFDAKATATQTAFVLALQFDLLPESLRTAVAKRLAEEIHDHANHLTTGFLGTPYLLPVLSRFGYNEMAYELLLQQSFPSWLYPITKGATTIWEKWDAVRPDGSLQAVSFNHYAYGAVGQWFYENIAGINPLSPGFKKIKIQPAITPHLSWARGSYKCAFGMIKSSWRRQGKIVTLAVTIPEGTSAEVYLPGHIVKNVKAGNHSYVIRNIE